MIHRHHTTQPSPPKYSIKHRLSSNVRRDLAEYVLTDHALTRAAQRNLSSEDLQYVLCHGRAYYVADSVTFFLGRRDIPKADRADDTILRLEGTAVITASQQAVIITTWRNRNGMKNIRRKFH